MTLFLLPFDHRSSFKKVLFGIKDRSPTTKEATEISAYKNIIYEAFKQAIANGVPKSKAGILVDEEFGLEILKDAQSNGYLTACCVEKSGQEEFDFEYGADYKEHILKIRPDFVKALVRYNSEGDRSLNSRQADRLKLLSEFCHENGFRFMFELLVPATSDQLAKMGGDRHRYDLELRPSLMVHTLKQLQSQGVEPDIWKVEGLYSAAEYTRLADQARTDGRHHVDLIVLGRNASKETIGKWLSVAAQIPAYKGFAIGRTVWEASLEKVKSGEYSPLEASRSIAENYRFYCDLWTNATSKTSPKSA